MDTQLIDDVPIGGRDAEVITAIFSAQDSLAARGVHILAGVENQTGEIYRKIEFRTTRELAQLVDFLEKSGFTAEYARPGYFVVFKLSGFSEYGDQATFAPPTGAHDHANAPPPRSRSGALR